MTITPTIELVMLGALPCVAMVLATLASVGLVWDQACQSAVRVTGTQR